MFRHADVAESGVNRVQVVLSRQILHVGMVVMYVFLGCTRACVWI